MPKNENRKQLDGYAETQDGLVRVSIIFEDDKFYGVWENDDLHDGLETFRDVIDAYHDKVYASKEDFKKDKFIKITEFFDSKKKK